MGSDKLVLRVSEFVCLWYEISSEKIRDQSEFIGWEDQGILGRVRFFISQLLGGSGFKFQKYWEGQVFILRKISEMKFVNSILMCSKGKVTIIIQFHVVDIGRVMFQIFRMVGGSCLKNRLSWEGQDSIIKIAKIARLRSRLL